MAIHCHRGGDDSLDSVELMLERAKASVQPNHFPLPIIRLIGKPCPLIAFKLYLDL